jgi:hypothetical protein
VFGDSTPADALAEAAKKIDEALARLSK